MSFNGLLVNQSQTIPKPWGKEILITPERENLPYVGKIICINAGQRLSAQYHDKKQESWYLIEGRVDIIIGKQRTVVEMESGVCYSIPTGVIHRLVGHTYAEVLEVSTPEVGTTYRLEDDYNRPNEERGQA